MTVEEGKNTLKVEKEEARAKNRILFGIIFILSIALGLTLWQYFELKKSLADKGVEIEFMNDERVELEDELQEMLADLDTMETANDSMKVELANRKLEIEGLLAKVKDKDFAIYKLKKETKTLRTIMRGYVVTIDSLNTLNVGLRTENQQVRNTLSQERTKAKELEKTNENLSSKVALASRLDIQDVSVFGVQVKRNMTGKETDRSRRTDKLRACFILRENKVAKAEKKNLYLRIIAPDGQVLTKGTSEEFRFEFNGMQGYYSDKLTVDYNNESKEYCLDWSKPDDDYTVLPGDYKVFIYAEDYEMAVFNLELR